MCVEVVCFCNYVSWQRELDSMHWIGGTGQDERVHTR